MPAEQSNEKVKRWTLKVCPVHGPVERDHCRVVVERTKTHTRYCHGEQEVEVVPVDSPQVLSVEEARLLDRATTMGRETPEQGRQFEALLDRLSDFAEEADRG
jgi:hypothetical protein